MFFFFPPNSADIYSDMQRSWTRVNYSNPVCLFKTVALLFSGFFFSLFLSGWNMPALPPTSVAKLNIIPKLCVFKCRIVLCVSYEAMRLGSCTNGKGLWWTPLDILSTAGRDSVSYCVRYDFFFWYVSLRIKNGLTLQLASFLFPPSVNHLISGHTGSLTLSNVTQFTEAWRFSMFGCWNLLK